jgi:hypothetical protein
MKKRKLYVYADESGQDTQNAFFVVTVFVTDKNRAILGSLLSDIEKTSGKKNSKWNGSKHEFRKVYIEKVSECESIKHSLFFEIFRNAFQYIELTSLVCAKAILKKVKKDSYEATVFIDGFKKKEIEMFRRGLRDLRICTRKVRGVKKDENDVFIRLADSLCGLIRDAEEGNSWAIFMVKKLSKKGFLISL